MKLVDISGQKYGKLTAIRRMPADESPVYATKSYYLCLCECGEQKIVRASHLSGGKIVSCGCRQKLEPHKKHGLTGTATYKTWAKMIRRCYDPKDIHYHAYGGRGIEVCEGWLQSPTNFVADMGLRPTLKHTIDRKRNDGNYEPDNCRWATYAEQARNKSTNRWVEFDGRRLTVQDWAAVIGIKVSTLANRFRAGWPVERALTASVRTWPDLAGKSK